MRPRISTKLQSLLHHHTSLPDVGWNSLPSSAGASRRDFLVRCGGGFGAVALTGLLSRAARSESVKPFNQTTMIDSVNPLLARHPHFTPRAKRVIFLFMYGGPSHVDTFDYKPALLEQNGKPVPESFKQRATDDGAVATIEHCKDELFASPWRFSQHGQSGLWVSDLFPHLARRVDDLCLIKSLHCDSSNHAPATFQMNTGAVLDGKPSMGAWVTYGLGTLNDNLPGYVLLFDVGGYGGAGNWGKRLSAWCLSRDTVSRPGSAGVEPDTSGAICTRAAFNDRRHSEVELKTSYHTPRVVGPGGTNCVV